MEKLHYSLNHYFTHMLLWFKECVTAAGIDASLCNTDPMCHWSLCLRVEHVTLSLCESLWQSRYSTIYCVLRYTGCTVFYQNAEHLFLGFSDFQLDQLVIDSAMEKREMEHKHATIQQRVSSYICFSQIDQIKTVWFYGTKCLNGCRKLSEKVAKKFKFLASLDHFQLLLLRSFFYVSVSVQTVFSCLPSHTHTHTWHYPESESPFMPVCHWYSSVIEKASDRLDGLKSYTG